MHVYVLGKDGEAKIWMEPTIELVRNDGLSWAQLTVALRLLEERQDEIATRRWWNHAIEVDHKRHYQELGERFRRQA